MNLFFRHTSISTYTKFEKVLKEETNKRKADFNKEQFLE